MADLSAVEIAVMFVAFFAGGLVKGIIGMALPVVAVGLVMMVAEPLTTLAVMVFPILISNLMLFVREGIPGAQATIRRFWPLILSLMAAMWLTARLASDFPTVQILLLLGLVMVGFVILSTAKPNLSMPARLERPLAVVTGVIGGFLGGSLAIWGPAVQIYYMSLDMNKDEWMRSLGLVYFLTALPLMAGYIENGMLNRDTALISALACIPTFAGTWLGLAVQKRVPQETFRKLVLLAIFVLGLNYIRKALF